MNYQANRNQYFKIANDIAEYTSNANNHDLALLRQKVLAAGISPEVVTKALNMMMIDKTILSSYYNTLKQRGIGSIPLLTSLKKLTEWTFDAAVQILEKNDFSLNNGYLAGKEPEEFEMTIIKTMLLYLYFASTGQKDVITELKMIYPATLPTELAILDSTLIDNYDDHPILWVPNAGYVYGGQMLYEGDYWISRGIDCSAYAFWVSYYYYNPPSDDEVLDPSTKGASMAWHYYKQLPFKENSSLTNQDLKEALIASPDAFILDNYEPVELENIEPGDLVFWRKYNSNLDKYTFGHVAIFHEWIEEPKRFYGFEAARDYNFDGVNIEHVDLRPFEVDIANNYSFALKLC
jgi:hypothetical protein